MLTGAANHCAAAVVRADSKSEFLDAGDYYDAFGLVQEILGNIVWHVKDFLHDNAACFEAPLFFIEFLGVNHACYEGETCCGNH
jgi:hypothetical protein